MQLGGSFIIDNKLFQSYTRGGQGYARAVPIENGVVVWTKAGAWTGPVSTTTNKYPGSGALQTETEYVIGSKVQQGIWRGDKGYIRQVPIIDNVPIWSCAQN